MSTYVDDDIEFDFFDEPETVEASQRSRRLPRRGGGDGGGDGPKRPPLQTPTGLIPLARLVGLIAIAIGLAYDKRVAAVFVVSSIVVFVVLRGVAAGLMALARRLPRSRITMLRLAIANIYRPGALTPSVVMSLGLGLAVLVTITQIDGNLRRQFLAALPDRAPSFYFIDIPTADAGRFGAFLKQTAPQSTVEDVPMLRGRIVAARGVKA